MAAVELTTENFDATVGSGGLVLVDFWAEPGSLPEPVLEQLISKALGLDMDQVRKSLAEPAAS